VTDHPHPTQPPERPRHPSSHDAGTSAAVFAALALKPGDVFLDIGCGLGDHALVAARIVGQEGRVHALDADARCIRYLAAQAQFEALPQVDAIEADITRTLPLPDGSAAACLLAAVLHMPRVAHALPAVFSELFRTLGENGRVCALECGTFPLCGPPLPPDLAGGRIMAAARSSGFHLSSVAMLGYHYLMTFQKARP
jgi:ubiquinone/menaquinone biosynthesis C-methylase UbiE